MNQKKTVVSVFRFIARSNYQGVTESARGRRRLALLAAAILSVAGLAPLAQAQTIMTMKPFQIRMEVPVGFNGTLTNVVPLRIPTNGASGLDGTGTNWIIPNVNVGISGTPAGCTASLVDSGLVNPIGAMPINLNTNNASKSTNLIVQLVFNGNEVSGTTTLTITATGAGLPDATFLMPLEIAKIWNGSANAAQNGAGTWSDSLQWLGGVPGPDDNVVFTDLGTQTNSLVGIGGLVSTNYLTNCVITTSTVISSLRFGQTNGLGTPLTNYHNLYINDGVNLAIAGNDGFKLLRDYTFWTPKINVTIWGTNGTLIQTNENSNFSILTDGANAGGFFTLLDMKNLGNLYLDVNQLQLGDCFAYPNYLCIRTNNYTSGSTLGSSMPNKMNFNWIMARTNFVKAVYSDPYNYTNASLRNYSMLIGRADVTGGSSANDYTVNMGSNNTFYVDSICVGGYASLGSLLQFSNNNSYALFRGTNGGRMSMFVTADAAGATYGSIATNGANTKSVVDFTKGYVDMLVDCFYLSRDRSPRTDTGNGDSQTAFYMNSGIIDANTAILGFQNEGSQTNLSYCYATMVVSNTAVFKVNDTLTLGYTTCAAGSANAGGSSNPDYGQLTIGPGGTVMANNITVGGITKLSGNVSGKANQITMIGNASLIVSNVLGQATANGALGTLSFAGGNNSLTLFIDGSNPLPLVYVTNFTASGTGNKLIIGGIQNLTYPADVVLIAGASSGSSISASSFDAGVTMPAGSGLTGTLSTSGTNTINVHIINRAPNYLLWRAPAGATGTTNWDYTSKVWLDQNTGLMTNFDNPDYVAFDDAAGYATNIIISGATPMTPTAINMTNTALYYMFSGGGNQISAGTLNKYGTGTVEIDDNTGVSVQLNQGVLTGFSPSSVGGVSVASGAAMNYFGAIGGSLNCAGTATSHGSIAGTISVLTGGIVTNSGSVANAIFVLSGGLLVNSGSGSLNNIGTGSSGSPQVASGGTFINGGTIVGDVLFVNGTFEDLGGTSISLNTSFSVGSGGTFIPGGDGIGTSAITTSGGSSFPGAALLTQGSTNIFKVDAELLRAPFCRVLS